MRIIVALLTLLGFVAAGAAAVLTTSLKQSPVQMANDYRDPEITILIASRPIAAMTMLEENGIEQKAMKKSEAPAGAFTDPAQVTGRMVSSPLLEGQAITTAAFPRAGSGLQVAGVLPRGKRAVTVALQAEEGLGGLLYPGSLGPPAVKVHGVFPSNRGYVASSPRLQFHRVPRGDSAPVVTPFMQVGTYPTRNFATLGPS